MKLITFTPTLESSAIARMAALVTKSLLAAGHEITIVSSEDLQFAGHPRRDFGCDILPWHDGDRVRASALETDGLIYHIGDNYGFHRGCLEWIEELGGAVCLHDYFVGYLFCGWAQTRREQARQVLQNLYGADVANSYFNHACQSDFIERTRTIAPLTEWIGSLADGVITHSSWDIQRLLSSCPGPVRTVALPYDAGIQPKQLGRQAKRDEPFRLLTVGHANRNKRISSVIRAIGGCELLQSRIQYTHIGHAEASMISELSAVAGDTGVDFRMLGEASQDVLNGFIERSNAISCLRWPALEAASASAIEGMLCGKPILVTDTGFYSEIPDEFVIKINPHCEVESIQQSLQKLLLQTRYGETLGLKAKTWASRMFYADKYAERLVEHIEEAKRSSVTVQGLLSFKKILEGWGGRTHTLANPRTAKTLNIFDPTKIKTPTLRRQSDGQHGFHAEQVVL
ncbi:glycosyltransferase [Stratiformator vulcanicus]|uniref:Glycosyl transferases group 1 n=1 Tax=Stratiformator vulcanicus TaxID=2527980 RepID=A0A517QWE9_9PLAN|nr:glycosyltransferase [Stratiformator vulcanicus]QDT35989.1 Glycosyl transferases group 1 [Stratiformator vulcanicus]